MKSVKFNFSVVEDDHAFRWWMEPNVASWILARTIVQQQPRNNGEMENLSRSELMRKDKSFRQHFLILIQIILKLWK